MKEKIGTYWKTKDSATIYWSKNSTNIRKDHTFDSAQEYRKHRVAHGYGPGWSGILVLNNYIHDPDDDIKIQEQRINWANHDHCGSEICEKKFDKNKQKEKKEIQKNIKINVDEKKLFTKMEPFDEMLPFCM